MNKKTDFPQFLYITKDFEGDNEELLVPWKESDANGVDKEKVAIYRLQAVRTLRINYSLK